MPATTRCDRRLEIGIEHVGRGHRGRVVGIEPARRGDPLIEVDLVGSREVVAVQVDPAIGRRAGRGRGVADADRPGVQLSGGAGDAGPGHGLARRVEGVGQAGTRRPVVPGERRLVAGEGEAGHHRREGGVGQRRAGQRLAVLAIEADADVERPAIARDRVAGVEVQVAGTVAARPWRNTCACRLLARSIARIMLPGQLVVPIASTRRHPTPNLTSCDPPRPFRKCGRRRWRCAAGGR